MIKRIMILLLFLIFIIAGLTGYQWLLYDKLGKLTERVQTENLEIGAEIVHNKGKLSITQKVSNLGQDNFLVEIPKGAKDFNCIMANGENCETRKESNFLRIVVGSEPLVTLKYLLPIDDGKDEYWNEYAFVQFFSNDQKPLSGNFAVSLLEEVKKSNMWFSGALTEARVDKEHISYFAWTKMDTSIFPLYMLNAQLKEDEKYNPYLSIFTLNTEHEDFDINQWFEQLPSNNGLTIVQTSGDQVYKAPLLVVVPKGYNMDKIEELAIGAYLQNYKKPNPHDIEWIWNVLPSLILDRPVGNGKELEMSKELVENLQPEVKKGFASWLLKQSKNKTGITLADLDKQLSELSSLKTIFFEKNESKNNPFVPLYYIDGRKVFYGDEEINLGWNAVEKKGQILFPFKETLENLGMEEKDFPESNNLDFIDDERYIAENELEERLKIEVIKRIEGIYLR